MPKPVKKRSQSLNDATLPAPVRKAVRKAKRPSSDPISRAKQLQAEHMAKVEGARPPWAARVAGSTSTTDEQGRVTMDPPGRSVMEPSLSEQLRAHMARLGAKGGKVSGAKRMQMPEAKRKAIAKKGAAARWAKRRSSTNG